jgi:Fic family protein
VDEDALRHSPIGQLVTFQGSDPRTGNFTIHNAYLAEPLPENVELGNRAWTLASQADNALGKLQQACAQVPNPRLLIMPALTKEALATSALEGTYAAMRDVLEARLNLATRSSAEVREILGYQDMAERAFEWVQDRPISVAMLSDLQGMLMSSARHRTRDIGMVRQHQVRIGPVDGTIEEARFIPAPPGDQLTAGLAAWEEWINRDHELPIAIVAALAHYQFETLHPFADGNGRLGRLVIVLQLLRSGAIPDAALTISPWLLRRRTEYADLLLSTSQTGDWNPWVEFFCAAVKEQCETHLVVAQRLVHWLETLRQEIIDRRWGGTILQLAHDLIDWPIVTMPFTAKKYDVSPPAAKSMIDRLVAIGVLKEMTGKRYGRVFAAVEVMEIVEGL